MADPGYLHRRSDNFGKVPHELMHDTTITDGAVRLYAHMHWRYGSNCDNHEGLRSMAKFMGVSETTITNRIKELEARNWVITIERGYDEKTGKFLTPFYHVFELQDEAIAWRKSPALAEGERVRPMPEARARKSRKGIGGNPKNLSNSSCPGNSSSSVLANSSCHYPEAVDPDTRKEIDTNVSIAPSPQEEKRTTSEQNKVVGSIEPQKEATAKTSAATRDTRRKPPAHAPHFEALIAAMGIDPETVKGKAGKQYWDAAYSLKQSTVQPDEVRGLYLYVKNMAKRDNWSSWGVNALVKRAPEYLAERRKNQPKPEPPAAPPPAEPAYEPTPEDLAPITEEQKALMDEMMEAIAEKWNANMIPGRVGRVPKTA